MIEQHAPQMARILKKEKQWDTPSPCITRPADKEFTIVMGSGDRQVEADVFDKMIEFTLDDCSELGSTDDLDDDVSDDINEAISIMLTSGDEDILASEEPECSTQLQNVTPSSDVDVCASDTSTATSVLSKASTAKHLLKSMQPYRERPSKDRRKRFCVGNIHGDDRLPNSHDIQNFQYWAITPQNKMIGKAKCFIQGQIISLFHLGVLCEIGKKSNKNIKVTLELFTHVATDNKYTRIGRSGLVNACSVLIVDVTQLVTVQFDSDIKFNYQDCDCLCGYFPYHEDVDIEGRQPNNTNEVEPQIDDNDDPYIVEKILERHFHHQRNQYEYLVQWMGYDDHTWEVPDNIPVRVLKQYENASYANRQPSNASYSLRPTRKLTAKDDFI